ncbi:MAG: hypothetical protein JST11_01735 [Acidobacteria bacterium]|nr:hypothetical protein [Acidobacteriota bacterium]
MQTDRNLRRQVRRMSMLGTVFFVLGIIAAVSAVVTRSQWLTAAAAILLAPGVVMLYRAGKSLE